jgi:hypothetical protein
MVGLHGEVSNSFPSWLVLHFLGTPLAHRATRDLRKLAIRGPGLADAGSVNRSESMMAL